ncbi:MAG: DUF1934 domain-containing protein, partial [Clostridia bacterium]|nr:DUF1934 domain-containing protein [Clostridia bacterium]
MTKQNVMIDILTSRIEMNMSLFDEDAEAEEIEESIPQSFEDVLKNFSGEMPEPTEMLMEGKLLVAEHRVELVYAESELTGMQGSLTAIGFEPSNPDLVSMVRTGPVRTAMTFEEGKRHICLYNTPFSEFEVCVRTIKVNNRLLEENKLELDYLIEIHGAQAEHCKMTVTVRPG